MGGIRLDWEIESNRVKLEEKEDAMLARSRRWAVMRLLVVISTLLVIIAVIVLVVMSRLRDVEMQLEQLLRDTVETEVAALRIGDRDTFEGVQRSATDDWRVSQLTIFDRYQSDKVDSALQLTGNILDLTIDDQRARVHVEEIVDGVPYTRVWFYWRYEDGWYHVPPDYTFWGSSARIEGNRYTIRYQQVDAPLAAAMDQKLTAWLDFSCTMIGCGDFPWLTVDIVPNQVMQMSWAPGDAWQLVVPSPYTGRARSDMPFEATLQIEAAALLAERFVNHVTGGWVPVYPADAAYLRSTVVSWLVGRFVQIDSGTYLIDSLSRNYGDVAIGRLLQLLQPTSDIGLLANVVGVPLEQANLDWRDFLTWRLQLEQDLITNQDEANWLSLYDTREESVRLDAYARYNAGPILEDQTVILVQPQTADDGTPQLYATVRIGNGNVIRDETVLFNLVNGVWRRAS